MKKRMLRLAAAFTVLNLPFWLMSRWYFIDRPRMNLDLLMPAMLAAIHPVLAALALALLWAMDLITSESLTYHFLSPLDFLQGARRLGDLHWRTFFNIGNLALGTLFASCALLAYRLVPKQTVPWAAAAILATVVVALDIGNGSSMLWQRPVRVLAMNVSGSPTTSLTVRLINVKEASPLHRLPENSSATSRARLSDLPVTGGSQRALLFIVESWGIHRDARVQRWLLDQLSDRGDGVKTGTFNVPFAGPTTAAELRELCGLVGGYAQLDAARGADCLPATLARAGWRTVGLHGFSPWMFDRKRWWPLIGLQITQFASDLQSADSTVCGSAFAGVCDERLITTAFHEAETPRTFVYALTLNSHLPLAQIAVPPELNAICRDAGTGAGVCQLTATIGKAFQAIRDGARRSRMPTTVVVVGDHAPPFARLTDREQYSADLVPAVEMQLRGGGQSP